MLHPSYSELMNKVNSEVAEGEKPIVNSRYSIVIAAARRARQIVAGAESTVDGYETKKPVSVAVEELMSGAVKIVSGGDDYEDKDEFAASRTYNYSFADEDDELAEEVEYEGDKEETEDAADDDKDSEEEEF